jgi:hypothetical protein
MSERSSFLEGFLAQASERPSQSIPSVNNAATGSTEMLDGYLDIHKWAREYLRRIGQGQADENIAVVSK